MRYNTPMALSWGERRKYTYVAVGIFILLLLAWGAYATFFSTQPTCFDAKQDGNEQGIDCGGSCSLICPNQATQPTVAWARTFLTATSSAGTGQINTYTAAAYIQNTNVGAGAHNVAYSFELFDANNDLVVEKDGVTDLPPLATIPIVEPNISAGQRTVTHALFAFSSLPSWVKVPQDAIPPVEVTNQALSPDGSRLSLTLQNNTVKDASNLTVVGVLFDANGAALAASKSLVASLPHKSSQDVVFTWPLGTPGVVRAEITVLPSF